MELGSKEWAPGSKQFASKSKHSGGRIYKQERWGTRPEAQVTHIQRDQIAVTQGSDDCGFSRLARLDSLACLGPYRCPVSSESSVDAACCQLTLPRVFPDTTTKVEPDVQP